MRPGIRSFVDCAVRPIFGLSSLAALLWVFVGVAHAHGGGPGLISEPCMQQAGVDESIHLAVYQPEFNPFSEYCRSIPKPGPTLLVFDLMGTELPGTPVSLQVVEDDGRVQVSVPARRYGSGVADLQADLPRGRYMVLVSLHDPGGSQRFAFPLAVGARWDGLVLPIVTILIIGVLTAGYCVFQIKCIASEGRNSAINNHTELRSVRKDY